MTQGKSYEIKLTTEFLEAFLYVASSCAAIATECGAPGHLFGPVSAQSATVTYTAEKTGDHVVAVDSDYTSAFFDEFGDFELSVVEKP